MVIYRSRLHKGLKRNFQLMPGAQWLDLLRRHIPDRFEHLVPYVGWYSNRCRARRPAAKDVGMTEDAAGDERSRAARASKAWARLIHKVYEVDPSPERWCSRAPSCTSRRNSWAGTSRPTGRRRRSPCGWRECGAAIRCRRPWRRCAYHCRGAMACSPRTRLPGRGPSRRSPDNSWIGRNLPECRSCPCSVRRSTSCSAPRPRPTA